MDGRVTAQALVIGVGNRDRGDDAIGPVVVDVVRERFDDRYATCVVEGDLSDLSLSWHQDQDVVIVDAMVSGRPAGDVWEFDALEEQLRIDSGLLSSHGVGLAEAIELARILDRLPRSLTIIAIEATTFGQFDELTPEVAGAADRVVDRIEKLIDEKRTHARTRAV